MDGNHSAVGTTAEPAEAGLHEYPAVLGLVQLVDDLARHRGQGAWPMPLIALRSRGPATGVDTVLATLLVNDERSVPHASLAGTGDLREVLDAAHDGLSRDFGVPRLTLRHYRLARWVTTRNLRTVGAEDHRRTLVGELRQYLRLRNATPDAPAQAIGGLIGAAFWLVAKIFPAFLLRLIVAGRLLGLGREFHWIVRQQYPSPRPVGGFFAMARHVALQPDTPAFREQLDRLLVHAFLQDLRVAYRRRPWRLSAWRRTAAPVLVVAEATAGTGGAKLLATVDTVRRETRENDPLLAVGCHERVPPTANEGVPLIGARGTYDAWRARTTQALRAGTDSPWFIRLTAPHQPVTPLIPELPVITPVRVPLAARPMAAVLLVLALLVALGGWYGKDLYSRYEAYQANCWSTLAGGAVRTEYVAGECIGYRDGGTRYFSTDVRLMAIQRTIFEQNEAADARLRTDATLPYVTLVYLGSLTKPRAQQNEETFAAEREELQGMAAAQAHALGDRKQPLMRIVVANAGQEMSHSDRVVPMLAGLAKDDPSVLAVIGLVESRTGTRTAIGELADAQLPTIVPTLSADHIGDGSNYYFQISAPNLDEARLIRSHATKVLKRPRILNVYTYGTKGRAGAADDLYVETLRADLRAKFGADYEEVFWSGAKEVDFTNRCADTYQDGFVFFGGRYSEFGGFAEDLANQCNGRAILVADDSVNRYMANSEDRRNAPSNLPLTYVSKGALAFCDQLGTAQDTPRTRFRKDVEQFLGACKGNAPLGERVGLAYDAAQLVLTAAYSLVGPGKGPLSANTRAQLRDQIRLTDQHFNKQKFAGATGLIDFDTNGVATGKRLTLLCAPDISRAFATHDTVPVEVNRGWRDRARMNADLRIYRTKLSPPRACQRNTRAG